MTNIKLLQILYQTKDLFEDKTPVRVEDDQGRAYTIKELQLSKDPIDGQKKLTLLIEHALEEDSECLN